jgi:hypothetical protein
MISWTKKNACFSIGKIVFSFQDYFESEETQPYKHSLASSQKVEEKIVFPIRISSSPLTFEVETVYSR